MFLSTLDIIGITIALISQLFLNIFLIVFDYRLKKSYNNTVRLLKWEREARAYREKEK